MRVAFREQSRLNVVLFAGDWGEREEFEFELIRLNTPGWSRSKPAHAELALETGDLAEHIIRTHLRFAAREKR